MLSRRTLLSGLALAPLAARADEPLDIGRLYVAGDGFTDYARAREGRRLPADGFMAPPLTAESRFFVLGVTPMSICPFCDTEAEWPDNILAVYAKRVIEVAPFYRPIRVEGVLRLGAFTDPDTGFVSMVRLEDAAYRFV